ncbi:latexin isoform X2 [Engraulis encrasicolus]|uniref:latexin isoform X2 n=1 Tax=Engraulis encrasicolus TaxID=184585 RepID=UPI002FD1F6A3
MMDQLRMRRRAPCALWVFVLLLLLSDVGLGGPLSPGTEVPLVDSEPFQSNAIVELEVPPKFEGAMPRGELVPHHYPAQRAAKVVQHYLNTRYGSPYRRIMLDQVHKAGLEDLGQIGKKYHLELSLKEFVSDTDLGQCSAEVLFSGPQEGKAPQVQCSCEGLKKLDTRAEEEALFQRLNTSGSLLSGSNIPDSYGHMTPEMTPMWHLGGVASSFIMLRESSEDTLYNMAQIANVTQLETENNQLRFNFYVLLHDMISQEILHWKLLATWSPAGGVSVSQTVQHPKCQHGQCKMPLAEDIHEDKPEGTPSPTSTS